MPLLSDVIVHASIIRPNFEKNPPRRLVFLLAFFIRSFFLFRSEEEILGTERLWKFWKERFGVENGGRERERERERLACADRVGLDPTGIRRDRDDDEPG